MANTSVIVEMNIDVPKQVLAPTAYTINLGGYNPTLSDTSHLLTNDTTILPLPGYDEFITLEHNINILDGSLTHCAEDFKTGYFRSRLSDNNCNVELANIYIDFGTSQYVPFKISGITFYFGDNRYPDEFKIRYNGNSNTSNLFTPNNKHYPAIFTNNAVSSIAIEFTKTRFPRMFIRVHHIRLGLAFSWEGTNVIDCKLVEEISPISNVLPIGTADVTIYSADDAFNILNPQGIYTFLTKGYPVKIYGVINSEIIPMGTFFLDTWDGSKPYEITFHMFNTIGILEQYQYEPYGLTTYKVGDLIADILSKVKQPIEYQIDDDISSISFIGFLERGNIRDVLQRILFTVGACADDTRDGILKIYKPVYDIDKVIEDNVITSDVNVTKTEPVTGINVTSYSYSANYKPVFVGTQLKLESEYEQLYTGQIPRGGKVFYNDFPSFAARYNKENGSDSNWSNVSWERNSNIKFEVLNTLGATDNFIVQVCKYNESTSIYEKTIESKSSNPSVANNVIKVEKNKLISSSNVEEFANNLANYYGITQLKIETEYMFDGRVRTARRVAIYTDYDRYAQGFVLKQSIDLSGGFISKLVMLGVVRPLEEKQYMTSGNDNLGHTGQYDLIADNNIQL